MTPMTPERIAELRRKYANETMASAVAPLFGGGGEREDMNQCLDAIERLRDELEKAKRAAVGEPVPERPFRLTEDD